ncbi:MAG: hypothetical protein AB7E55_24360 [Pigmentiphaga sp.]
MKKSVSRFVPVKVAAAITGAATAVMGGSAFAAGELQAALTDSIDKSDLWAGGAIILGACAVIAMINLGRRLAR